MREKKILAADDSLMSNLSKSNVSSDNIKGGTRGSTSKRKKSHAERIGINKGRR